MSKVATFVVVAAPSFGMAGEAGNPGWLFAPFGQLPGSRPSSCRVSGINLPINLDPLVGLPGDRLDNRCFQAAHRSPAVSVDLPEPTWQAPQPFQLPIIFITIAVYADIKLSPYLFDHHHVRAFHQAIDSGLNQKPHVPHFRDIASKLHFPCQAVIFLVLCNRGGSRSDRNKTEMAAIRFNTILILLIEMIVPVINVLRRLTVCQL